VGPPGPAAPAEPPDRGRRGSPWPDRVIGIVLGIVLGIGIITAFLFLGSEETIDAPALNDEPGQSRPAEEPGQSPPAPRIQEQ